MTYLAFWDKGSKLYLPCGTRDRVCKSGTVPDVSGRLAAMCTASVSHTYVRLIGQRHASAFASVMQDLRKQLYTCLQIFVVPVSARITW